MSPENRPRVGIGVMLFRDGKVLMMERKGSHGEGEYAFPGGHQEFGETIEEGGRRETREEAGIEIANVRFQFLANVLKYAGKHYAHIGLIADWSRGEPERLESDKTGDWGWYDPSTPPEPLFEMVRLAFESLRTGQIFFDGQ